MRVKIFDRFLVVSHGLRGGLAIGTIRRLARQQYEVLEARAEKVMRSCQKLSPSASGLLARGDAEAAKLPKTRLEVLFYGVGIQVGEAVSDPFAQSLQALPAALQ